MVFRIITTSLLSRNVAYEGLQMLRQSSSFSANRPRLRNWNRRNTRNPFSRPLESVPQPSSPNLTFEERVRQKMADTKQAVQLFDYFLVLDFEATCDRTPLSETQEIIEFPVIKVDAKTMMPVSTFHQYVQPRVHPHLTPFCTQLTGIIQDMVENQPFFEEAMDLFDKWLHAEGLLQDEVKFAFATCGDWDLGTMLPMQSKYHNFVLPPYFDTWINVKHAFSESLGHYPRGLMLMLETLGIQHTGRHHSGIDDCANIVAIMQALAARNHVFRAQSRRPVFQKRKTGRS